MNEDFWDFLQNLVNSHKIVIDRPKGSAHGRFKGEQYPVNYGYLEGTSSMDLDGIDVWIGSNGGRKVVGILCTIDLHKKDTEVKIILDCTDEEIVLIKNFVNTGQMRAIFVKKGE
jgi:inorganic pyrophosphatase